LAQFFAIVDIYGPGTDHALARNGEFFLPNQLSSTTGLTNGSGALTQSYLYGPFGESLNVPSDSNPFQFTGRENDGDGLLYYRARYYNPAWGRFASADPAGFDGGINPYIYAWDNPVNHGDASGLDPNSDPQADYRWMWGGAPPPPGVSAPDPNAPTAAPAVPFTGGPDALNTATDFFSGWGDAVSGGLTDAIRQAAGLNHVVNKGSGSYWAGTATGVVNDLLLPGGEAETSGEVLTIEPVATGSNCFTAGTPVAMGDGSTKPIEAVQPGDLVVSRDPATGETAAKRVVRTFQRQREGSLVLRLASGEELETTEGHPFFIAGSGWVLAGNLWIGAPIETLAGQPVELAGMEPHFGTVTVYNMEVEDFHTYFVGHTAGGALVHNVVNLTYAGSVTYDQALTVAPIWLGDGYTESLGRAGVPGGGVFRSADGLRQFRMAPGDLLGTHGNIGPHVHFQVFDPNGVELENLHVPITPC
jgi:RHS repeat-associated protein